MLSILKRILIAIVILAAIPTTTFAAKGPSCDNGATVEYSRSADEGPMRPGEQGWIGSSGASYYKCPEATNYPLIAGIFIFVFVLIIVLALIKVKKAKKK